MASTSRQKTWVSGDTLTAADLNAEFDGMLTGGINSISNANVATNAAIAQSKLAGTWPSSGIIVGTTDTQTLSGKTLTSPTINTPLMKGAYEAWVTATDGATITFALADGNKQRVTLGGNRTLALSGVQGGHVFLIRLLQDGTGSRLVTWFSGISWVGGTVPTLTTTANKADVFGFVQTASGAYDGFVVGQNL